METRPGLNRGEALASAAPLQAAETVAPDNLDSRKKMPTIFVTRLALLLSFLLLLNLAAAQEETAAPAPAKSTEAAAATPAEAEVAVEPTLPESWADTFKWRCAGPANMGGRIVDLAVSTDDPNLWWVATASGGLLKTTNNGTTFTHQFDSENTVSIGDIAVAPSNSEIVWVGTGESNPRNSVSWGDGVYKSVDGGKTWKHMGLKDTFQIGRIRIHPENPDIVYIGALGRLWGDNEERGLFKTTDGGATWEKILYVDDKTGVIDVAMHPGDPQTLLVATYERQRDVYDSNDPSKKMGPGSAIYKTDDGGQTFRKVTQGLPSCQFGRIGLDWYQKDSSVVYAVIESERVGKEPENAPYFGISGEDVDVGARLTEIVEDGPAAAAGLEVGDIVLSVEDTTIHSYAELMRTVRHYLADDTVKMEISRDRKSINVELTFSLKPGVKEDEEKAGAATERRGQRSRRSRSPFSSGLGGQRENIQDQQGKDGFEYGGIYCSRDSGNTWERINSVNPRPMYFSQVRVDPGDNKHLWVLGISLYRSSDGGATFSDDGADGSVHVDHHAMWIDPHDGRHVILGNDGGIYVTYDRGETWRHLNTNAIGQFYHVAVGPQPDYMIYGGLQDNGTWGGPSRSSSGWGTINEDWITIGGGDGFICQVNEDDPDEVYFASQNGSLGRINIRTGEQGYMRPRAPRGTRYRFNWKTPYLLSHHNQQIYYCAGNYVFRSLNKGDTLKAISPEIALTDKGSASALAESRFDSDVLYVGTDDGALWRTLDGGHEWSNLIDFGGEPAPPEEPSETRVVAAAQPAGAEPEPSRKATDEARRSSSGEQEGRRGGSTDRADGGGRSGHGAFTVSGGRSSSSRIASMLREMDSNGDGLISEDEVPERMRPIFSRVDANGDGAIDKSEIDAVAQGRSRGRGRAPQDPRPPEPVAEILIAEPITPPSDPEPERVAVAAEATATEGTQPIEVTAQPLAASSTPAPEEQSAAPEEQPAAAAKTKSTPAQEKPKEEKPAPSMPAQDDPISGDWLAKASAEGMPGEREIRLTLELREGGKVSGYMASEYSEGDISDGRFDAKNGTLTFAFSTGEMDVDVTGTISKKGGMTGEIDIGGGMFTMSFSAERTSKPGTAAGGQAQKKPAAAKNGEEQYEWKPLAEWLPGPRRISSIESSHANKERVYVTLDGHRSDDDEPYLFVSKDQGTTWRPIRGNLPTSAGSTRVLREDLENPDLLYLGTEFSAWVSIDRGASWTPFAGGLPTVAVHELAQHASCGDLVAATHGRSIWITNVTALRQLTEEARDAKAFLCVPRSVAYWRSTPSRGGTTPRYTAQNPPTQAEIFYSLSYKPRRISLKITELTGETVKEFDASATEGLHRVTWDMRKTPKPSGRGRGGRFRRGARIDPGEYLVVLAIDNQTLTQRLRVERDPSR